MANKWGNDAKFIIDNAAGSTTDISAYVNQAGIRGACDILDQTGFGNTNPDIIHGIASATIPVNGFINSTTDGIFGPLVGNRTSVTKTTSFYNGLKYYTGEFLPSDVEISGDPRSLLTFSANMNIDGAVTRTSVAPS